MPTVFLSVTQLGTFDNRFSGIGNMWLCDNGFIHRPKEEPPLIAAQDRSTVTTDDMPKGRSGLREHEERGVSHFEAERPVG